jgi:hypothetical protein
MSILDFRGTPTIRHIVASTKVEFKLDSLA